MISNELSRAFISGEAGNFDNCNQIPSDQIAELYIAIRHIKQEGKEAFTCMTVCEKGDKITVKTKHWQICYREEAQGLQYESLQYRCR